MLVLSMDSSCKVSTVALLNEYSLLGEYSLNNKKEHSALLMPMVDNLLKDCKVNISDIDGYVISKGPGSFTGLRIGMATVKGLSFGSNRPYVSVSSLDALGYSLSTFDGIICPIMDALRDNVYTALYESNLDGFKRILEPTSMELPELLTLLNEKKSKVIFTGDALERHKEYIQDNFKNAYFAPNHLSIIRASSLGELGLKLLQEGIFDSSSSAPIYLKKPQAERELEKRLKINDD